jgi:hypothetical protein
MSAKPSPEAAPAESRTRIDSAVGTQHTLRSGVEYVLRVLEPWIEILLVDENDGCVGGAAYEVKLSDGAVRKGKLDEKGFARLERLPAGACTVTFPEYDGTSWEEETAKETWLEVVLSDDAGQPAAGAAYKVTLADTTVREGKLDALGRARLEGLPEGACTVSFPEYDGAAWERDLEVADSPR